MMKKLPGALLSAALALTACSPPERQAPEVDLRTAQEAPLPTATDTLVAPAHGDHAAHGAAADPHAAHTSAPASGAADHAGHARAPQGRTDAAAAEHAAHAEHAAPARSAAAPSHADHAAHAPQARPQPAGRDAHAGHGPVAPAPHAEHAAPIVAPAAPAALTSLVSALLEDAEVQRRIQEDAELREMWADPAVRRHLSPGAEMSGAMRRLLTLVQRLLDDPQVQARIEADAELRALWADQGVRRQILEPRQP